MQIVVCMKQVLDPEMPHSAFKVDRGGKRVISPPGTPPVVSPYDENALEAALRLKNEHGAGVVVVSAGYRLARPVLRKALAAGADELVLLDDAALEDLDSFATASVLSAAIRSMGRVDLVLTGRQAADSDSGIVGCAVAEELGLPCITIARKIEVRDSQVRVERVLPNGFEVTEAPLPCVITVDSDLGELREITLRGLSEARTKSVHVLNMAGLGLNSPPGPSCELLDLYVPTRGTICEMIQGDSPAQLAMRLADRLDEESLLRRSGSTGGC